MWLYLYEIYGIGKFMEAEHRSEVTRGWKEEKNKELLLNGYRISVSGDEKVLETVAMVV